MSKAVRVPEPVYDKLSEVCAEQDLSMAEAASLLIDAELSEDARLVTEQELERIREASCDAAVAGYRDALLEAAQDSDTGAVTVDIDGNQVLIADLDGDRFWDTVLDVTAQHHSEQDR